MSVQHLYNIAKSIQTFINDKKQTTESIYRTIMTNEHLNFINKMFNPNEIPVLVFVAYEILMGNDNPKIVGEIYNNLFLFNIIEFGDTQNDIDCNSCDGTGKQDCDYCNGDGSIECNTCEGSGEDDEGYTCDTCDGDGIEECDDCDGNGTFFCDECGASGHITVYDRIPFTSTIYASYNTKLKQILESKLLRNEDMDNFNVGSDNSLLVLEINEIYVDDSRSEDINDVFANKSYIGNILERDEINLQKNGYYKVTDPSLRNLPERFED